MRILLRALGVALAALGLLAMAWASRAPLRVAAGDRATVRLSIGARPERIEKCVAQSDEQLAKLAPQMRQRLVCEGVTARYQLELRRDGELVLAQLVRAGGLRHDRQLYVFKETAVPPGRSSIDLRLTRIDTVASDERDASDETQEENRSDRADGQDGHDGHEAREAEARRRRRKASVPPALALVLEVSLAPREVLLLTYDPELRTLKAVRAPR